MASGLTGTYLFPYPLQTDPVDVAADVQALAQGIESTMVLKAPLASPALTGVPTAPTPNNADSSTTIATTAFVKNQAYLTVATASTTFAPIASPTFTGTQKFSDPRADNGGLVISFSVWNGAGFYGGIGTDAWARASGSSTDIAVKADTGRAIRFFTNGANERASIASDGTFTTVGKLVTAASVAGAASLNLPHGTAPSSPVNGDVWTTTIGMYARINGNTVGPFGTGATYTNSAPTAITGALWANSDYNSLSVYTGSRWASMTGTPPVTKTATYTLALGDEGSMLVMAGGTTNNITVPTNASVAFPIGSSIMIVQSSAIQTVISGAGVTFFATPGLKLRAQYSVATLLKIATDTWVVTGDVTA